MLKSITSFIFICPIKKWHPCPLPSLRIKDEKAASARQTESLALPCLCLSPLSPQRPLDIVWTIWERERKGSENVARVAMLFERIFFFWGGERGAVNTSCSEACACTQNSTVRYVIQRSAGCKDSLLPPDGKNKIRDAMNKMMRWYSLHAVYWIEWRFRIFVHFSSCKSWTYNVGSSGSIRALMDIIATRAKYLSRDFFFSQDKNKNWFFVCTLLLRFLSIVLLCRKTCLYLLSKKRGNVTKKRKRIMGFFFGSTCDIQISFLSFWSCQPQSFSFSKWNSISASTQTGRKGGMPPYV